MLTTLHLQLKPWGHERKSWSKWLTFPPLPLVAVLNLYPQISLDTIDIAEGRGVGGVGVGTAEIGSYNNISDHV